MIIQSGSYRMQSEREFTSKHAIGQSVTSGLPAGYADSGIVPFPRKERGDAFEGGLSGGGFLSALAYTKYGTPADDAAGSLSPAVRQGRQSTAERLNALQETFTDAFEEMDYKMKFSALNYLFRLFFGNNTCPDWQDTLFGAPAAGGFETYRFSEAYEETETTSFETTGTVVTADGRELDFNLSVGMSRSFYEETNACIIRRTNPMIDPLVIHLDGNIDSVSDQTFFFDLDADGTMDEVSSLNAGSGFLALDRNGDGQINDGSELFGALSGDGFAELAAYDLDGNGWIDEADAIYDKLRVWSVDESGKPRLFTLKESDVGAICLASAPTQFSITDEWNNARATVRASGFFLHESSGMAGSVQQIDLAAM